MFWKDRNFYDQRRSGVSDRCPFNGAIDCTDHKNQNVFNLPECCQKCGWNPVVFEARREALENAEKAASC